MGVEKREAIDLFMGAYRVYIFMGAYRVYIHVHRVTVTAIQRD